MALSFENKLSNFADLVIKVGLNLQPKQRLLIRGTIDSAPFVRLVTQRAYSAGSPEVNVIWTDDQISLARVTHAPDDVLKTYPEYLLKGHNDPVERGDAVLTVRSSDPELYKDVDGDKLSLVEKATRQSLMPFFEKISSSAVSWCLVSVPAQAWAAKVFPKDSSEQQIAKLWEAIFKTVRVDQNDPVSAWEKHLDTLEQRRLYLNDKQYASLKYKATGTDFELGLVDNHLWMGGTQPTHDGVVYVANLPTEEVFTMPHKDKANGVVSSSLPLSHAGNMIEDFKLTFKDGKVIEASAKRGESTLHRILETDKGARRLGEVALVPHSSPISQSGILFYDTLFDENAASHLALGRAYAFTVKDGVDWTPEKASEQGVNQSLTHVDFMIGSKDMDLDGVSKDGAVEAIMRQGEWVF